MPVPIVDIVNQPPAFSNPSCLMLANPFPRRLYPWGKGLDAEKANYEMNIGHVSAMGAYPQGLSPYGCEDMSGNVWEWTRSLLQEAYPYPLDEQARRQQEDLEARGARALRGGAFYNHAMAVRCTFRDFYPPNFLHKSIGFREVLSPYL
jgi:formylglycine-generating enzyme required for sulfatase activity